MNTIATVEVWLQAYALKPHRQRVASESSDERDARAIGLAVAHRTPLRSGHCRLIVGGSGEVGLGCRLEVWVRSQFGQAGRARSGV